METIEIRSLYKTVSLLLLYALLLWLASCGPIVFTSQSGPPPPPWFYPHRVEVVRYVYFPELQVYFDLRTHSYLYLENRVWMRNRALPPRYGVIDLNRQRYERIRGYDQDDIRPYDDQSRRNSGRSNRTRDGGRIQK